MFVSRFSRFFAKKAVSSKAKVLEAIVSAPNSVNEPKGNSNISPNITSASTVDIVKESVKKGKKTEPKGALENALKMIEASFGPGALMRLGDRPETSSIDVISTGSLGIDFALGIGGLPRGRIVEIFGPESSGKTTLALHVVAEAQRHGGRCAFIDAENAFDELYAKRLGVRTEDLYLNQPDSGEQGLEIVDTLCKSGEFDVIVVDSVAALVPRNELEGEVGDVHMGLQARMMAQALRKLNSNLNKNKTLVIFLNQIRMKIGVMFGNPETTPGGHALRYFASLRIDVRKGTKIMRGDQQVGTTLRLKVIKNKLAPPFKEVEVDVEFGKGIKKQGELITLGVQFGALKKTGNWYTYVDAKGNSTSLGNGRESAVAFLDANPDIAKALEEEIKKQHAARPQEPIRGPGAEEASPAAPAEAAAAEVATEAAAPATETESKQ